MDQRVSPGETTTSITEAELEVFEASAPLVASVKRPARSTKPANEVIARRPFLVRRIGWLKAAAVCIVLVPLYVRTLVLM